MCACACACACAYVSVLVLHTTAIYRKNTKNIETIVKLFEKERLYWSVDCNWNSTICVELNAYINISCP